MKELLVILGAYSTTETGKTGYGLRHVTDTRVESNRGKLAKPSTCPLKLIFE